MHADQRTTARYRFYDSTGAPLYFGIAIDPEQRWLGHRSTAWWPQVDHSRTVIDWYANRDEAHAAEVASIADEQPRHNRAHADYHPPLGMGATELRKKLANVIGTATYGEITFVTSRGRRIAAIVPAPEGERLWREQQGSQDERPRSSA